MFSLNTFLFKNINFFKIVKSKSIINFFSDSSSYDSLLEILFKVYKDQLETTNPDSGRNPGNFFYQRLLRGNPVHSPFQPFNFPLSSGARMNGVSGVSPYFVNDPPSPDFLP